MDLTERGTDTSKGTDETDESEGKSVLAQAQKIVKK
jgi:hypothetical protein